MQMSKVKRIEWIKKGLIYTPNTSLYWQASHAALPTRLNLGGGRYRIFFSSRCRASRAYVGSFDIDLENDCMIENVLEKPLLSPGDSGFFDDSGVQACSVVRAENGDIYMYYLGWNTSNKPPLFYTAIGLAISSDNGLTFHKYSTAPILQRSRYDPWMVSGGTVIQRSGEWIMYYLSGFRFDFTTPIPTSWYDIKIARSRDGIEWNRHGEVAIPLQNDETNISRLTIEEDGELYRAWFPVKRQDLGYRCGYAESSDGINWTRKDGMNLSVSDSGWDSEAIDKMEVIRDLNRRYMLYNGNNFGLEGIGLAISYD